MVFQRRPWALCLLLFQSAPCLTRSHLWFWQTVNGNIMALSITTYFTVMQFYLLHADFADDADSYRKR